MAKFYSKLFVFILTSGWSEKNFAGQNIEIFHGELTATLHDQIETQNHSENLLKQGYEIMHFYDQNTKVSKSGLELFYC